MCLAASDMRSLQVLGCFVGDNLQVDRCWLVRMFDLDRHCSEMIALAANCKCVRCVGPERIFLQDLTRLPSNEHLRWQQARKVLAYRKCTRAILIDPIHAAAMTNKKRGLACRFTANLRVST